MKEIYEELLFHSQRLVDLLGELSARPLFAGMIAGSVLILNRVCDKLKEEIGKDGKQAKG